MKKGKKKKKKKIISFITSCPAFSVLALQLKLFTFDVMAFTFCLTNFHGLMGWVSRYTIIKGSETNLVVFWFTISHGVTFPT